MPHVVFEKGGVEAAIAGLLRGFDFCTEDSLVLFWPSHWDLISGVGGLQPLSLWECAAASAEAEPPWGQAWQRDCAGEGAAALFEVT